MSLEQSVTALEQRNAELVSEVVRARDAVMGLSNMYTTITLGLAGTEDGQYFTVPGNGAYQKLYQHDGSQAPLIATYPSNSDLTDALTTLNTAMSDHVALPDPHAQYAEISGQVFTGEIVYYGAGGLSTNTSYGQGTLSSNTTGQFNTANGRDALSSNTTGDFNTANGREALTVNTTGFKNTANGTNALRSTTTGNKNTAIGMQSLKDITTGNGNTAVGERSGIGIETGSGNSIFGQDADGLASGLENNLILASGGVIRLQHDGVNTTTLQGNLVADKITASTGILFGTDTAAANTLDDYETGTWTPIITDAYGSFPSAITVANGTYTKIGNVVHCRFEIATSSSADVILNDRARFAGMPFNPDDLNIFDGSGTAFQYYLISGGVNAFWSILTGNTTQFILYNTSLDDLPDYTKGISGSFTYTAS